MRLDRSLALPIAAVWLAAIALPACTDDDSELTDETDVEDTDVEDTDVGDTEAPTVAIADDVEGVADGDITFTFTFSEDTGDSFTADDVSVDAGTKGAFANDGSVATLVVSPPEDASGSLSVDVAAGAFEDLAGNANAEAASASQDYDTLIPAVDTNFLDFELESMGVEGFGDLFGVVVEDPTDATNQVAQLTKAGSAQTWAGGTMHYCPNFGVTNIEVDATHPTLSLRFWSPDAGIPVLLKIEDSLDPGAFAEIQVTTTVAAAWESLSFDYSAVLNPAHTYDKISVFPNFGTDGATAGEKVYYVDDVTHMGKVYSTDCPPIPIELRPDPEDAWIGYNGGSPAVRDAFAGGAQVGQAEAAAVYVIPFRLPAIPESGSFTGANLEVYVIATGGDGSVVDLHGDLYGLPYRRAIDVGGGDVVQTPMFYADSTVDSSATLLVDDLLSGSTGNAMPVISDAAAIVDYVNAQISAGAGEGDIVYFRISPDAPPPIGGGYNWVLEAAVDGAAPPNRPRLTLE